MDKEFIVEGAMCMCNYGAAPGRLKVIDHTCFKMNGNKLVATTMTIGNAMQPPGFGSCNQNPLFPKPCMLAIVQWSNPYEGLKTQAGGKMLTPQSKGTCATGGTDCITLINTGQIPIPGAQQMAAANQPNLYDIDPMAEPPALSEEQINIQIIKGMKEPDINS